jgi:ketosteroid isomerase-like protein
MAIVLSAALFVAWGCAASVSDTREHAEAQMIEADLKFNEALANRDREAFRGYLAADAKFYGQRLLTSSDQVLEGWSAFMDETSGLTLTWAPDVAEAGASGDLGFTRGRYELRQTGEDGETKSQYGYYVSIWRKGEDGLWRAAVDIGTPGVEEPVPEG